MILSAKKTVIWDDLNEQTGTEKLANAKTMAEINQTFQGSGENPAFSREEIRTAAGYENVDEFPLEKRMATKKTKPPILPRNYQDPTGADALERRAMKRLRQADE